MGKAFLAENPSQDRTLWELYQSQSLRELRTHALEPANRRPRLCVKVDIWTLSDQLLCVC